MSLVEEALAKVGPKQTELRNLILKLGEDLEAKTQATASLRKSIEELLGPPHAAPPEAYRARIRVARPSIDVAAWQYGDWNCLRIEERTVGHNRPNAFMNDGIPSFRQNPETERWMGWISGIARDLHLEPLRGSVRVLFFPGLSYTFIAWKSVPERINSRLHPMDPDNAAKASLDALSFTYIEDREYRRQKAENARRKRLNLPEVPIVRLSNVGAWVDDAQVVDLLVYRLEQEGIAPVDRIALKRERRATIKAHKAKKVREEKALGIEPSKPAKVPKAPKTFKG